MARPVNIGEQSFEDLIRDKTFYVDKTDFIAKWYCSGDSVTLITRPRRFGKTLTLDMMNCFFSVRYKDQAELFSGLKVSEDKDIMALQGTMPVIYLSFTGIKSSTFGGFLDTMSLAIRNAAKNIKNELISCDIPEC